MKFKIVKYQQKAFYIAMFFVMCFGMVQAQTIAVKGIVTGDGGPLPGVSVLVKGTVKGTVTDFDGNYEINTNGNSTLVFSYIGFAVKEVQVNGKTIINIDLEEDISLLDEVVVIGYGAQKKREVTGAVAQVKAETIEKISTSDIGNALQGQIAGVNVTASSGQPGSDSVILIRGVNSVFAGGSPLYVVDGIPQDGNPQLSVAEIETIDVLKDAASAAIYGTRGSAGVILITTKSGKVGKMNIGITSYVGVQDITSQVPLMNFEEYLYANFIRLNNVNGTFPNNSFTTLQQNRYDFTNNTSLINMLQVDDAVIQNHSLNISGGKTGLTYNVSMNYFDQVGSLLNSGLERLNVRANTTYKKDKWKVTTGIGLRTDKQSYTPFRILLDGYRYKPYQQVLDPSAPTIDDSAGVDGSNDAVNSNFLTARLKQTDVRQGDDFNFRTEVNYQLLENLSLTGRASIRRNNNTRVRINPLFVSFDFQGDPIKEQVRSGVWNESSRSTNNVAEGIVTFDKTFGDNHHITLVGAYTAEKYTFESFFARRFDIFSNEVNTLEGTSLDPDVGTGTNFNQDRTNTLIGMLGRAQYDYKGRYLFSASIRRDGSSRFAKENRWIYAPSGSAAWIVSDENGWDNIFGDTFNFFKIRASYGTTGNQSLRDYSIDPTVQIGNDYVFGSAGSGEEFTLGAIQTAYRNGEAGWEKKTEKNFGMDFGFFKNKLTLSSDIYDSSRTDMLFPVLLPPSVGGGNNSTVVLNIGDMRNYGVEYSANYKHRGKLNWNISATYSANENLITKMSETNKFSYLANSQVAPGLPGEDLVTALREGYEAGGFFLIETDGLVTNNEELAEYRLLDPEAQLGALRSVDQLTVDTDGDGVADAGNGIIDADDRVYKGSGAPEYEVGLNFSADYKGLDFSMNWYAAIGGEIINGSKAYTYKQGTHKDLLYSWTETNPTSTIPAYRGRDHANFRGFTDFWLQDGSFARLKNITLGYTLSKKLSDKLKINKLRVYIAADNLLTITNYDGFDPEVGNDGLNTRGIDAGVYPISTQYRVGLNFNF